jgi:para-nitrobenzyl esterase
MPERVKLMNTVETDTGYISGMVIGKPGEEVRIFKGIPYAAPPIGDLRWKPPQPAAVWSGVKECTVFSPAAPQSVASLPVGRPSTRPVPVPLLEIPQSEDCLYLNILTPAKKATDKLPVMVWMVWC